MTRLDFDKRAFEDILITNNEYKLLKHFARYGPLSLPDHDLDVLCKYGLVRQDTNGINANGYRNFKDTFSITDKGIRYLTYRKQLKITSFFQYFLEKWIDFLALAVAIIALIRTL